VVIDAVLRAADPRGALEGAWVEPPPGPVLLVAFGKASAEMAEWGARRLGARLAGGVVIGVPERLGRVELPPVIACFPADHPLPTERNVRGASALRGAVAGFARQPGGRVVCLLSGGGSAHLTLPSHGLALQDLRRVNEGLQRAGAPIEDLNAVRKHTEELKGGRLGVLAAPAGVACYVMSDVVGDRLDVIASGPFAADSTTFADALGVLERWGCRGVSRPVVEHLERGASGQLPETPKPGGALFRRIRHRIIASNRGAVEGVRAALEREGFAVERVEHGAVGDAAEVGRGLARAVANTAPRSPTAWIVGGEPTVRVGSSSGRGGPSQELALACAVELERLGTSDRTGVISFSSDGIDGPTCAAGAALIGADLARARAAGREPGRVLEEHDSHTLLDAAGALIRTGATGTNVNHVAVGVWWA